jgi:DNA-binding NtrC family response regulator
LRERDSDAELLAEYFLQELNAASGTAKRLSRAAVDAVRRHAWPGNVRELRNAVQRAYIMADDMVELNLGGLACPQAAGEKLEFIVGTPLADMEREAIFATLDLCRGNKRQCAAKLGVSLKTLYNRLSAYQEAAHHAAL